MTEQAVRVERSGPVTTVYLHRPARRNAVDGPTAVALAAAFRAFDADPDAAAAVLHGEGGVFCSGADLTALGTERGNRVTPDGDAPMGVSRLRLSKPVIAAVSGYAVAGGLELALWCDLRVADETAVFGVFCRRWGVPLIDGGTVRLPRLIGTSRAMDMILTGRAVDAREALAFGLANRVVPAGQALAAAQRLAAELAAYPQVCLRSDRASVLDQEGLDEAAALASEFAHGRQALTGEAPEGAARFAAGAGRHGSSASWPPDRCPEPGCGHVPMADDPVAVAELIIRTAARAGQAADARDPRLRRRSGAFPLRSEPGPVGRPVRPPRCGGPHLRHGEKDRYRTGGQGARVPARALIPGLLAVRGRSPARAGGAQTLQTPVMACWQRNRQFTQPPAAARRCRADMKAANASAAAVAAHGGAVSTAARTAAVLKKWLTGPANTSQATATMAASRLAGRA